MAVLGTYCLVVSALVWDVHAASAWPGYGERCVQADRPCTLGEQLGNGGSWLNLLVALLGWIITALACTLGAPFWFDALSKLVKLRSSGAPPATAKGSDSSGAPPGSQLARSLASPVAGAVVTGAPPNGPAGQGDEFASKPRMAMSDALNDAERALDTDEVMCVQRGIEMPETNVSGWFDGSTRQAIAAWQRRMALGPVTGELTKTTDNLVKQLDQDLKERQESFKQAIGRIETELKLKQDERAALEAAEKLRFQLFTHVSNAIDKRDNAGRRRFR